MPKYWSYNLGDTIVVNQKVIEDLPNTVGLSGEIIGILKNPMYDYEVKLSNGYIYKFKEDELNLYRGDRVNFDYGDRVMIKHTGEEGIVRDVSEFYDQVEIIFADESMKVFGFDEVEKIGNNVKSRDINKNKNSFEEFGKEIGKLVDKKQEAYGDSVNKTYKLMKIYLDHYDNGNGTYTIPKSLLKHILLQVRIIDKQNRIFSNPDGDLMEENPYADCTGYSLLGMKMVEQNN